MDLGGGNQLASAQMRAAMTPVVEKSEQIIVGQHSVNQPVLKTSDGRTFYLGRVVGAGSYGQVRLGVFYKDDARQIVAIKTQSLRYRDGQSEAEAIGELEHAIFKEVALLKQASSPLMPLEVLSHGTRGMKMSFVMPAMRGTLQDLLYSCGTGADAKAWRATLAEAAFVQLAPALLEQHTRRRVFLNDIKPANILVDDCGKLCFSDFGAATSAPFQSVAPGGTYPYMAPEALIKYSSEKPAFAQSMPALYRSDLSDYWQLGATLAHVLAGQQTFFGHGAKIEQIIDEVLMSQRFVADHAEAWAQWPALRRIDGVVSDGLAPPTVERWLAEHMQDLPHNNLAIGATFALLAYEPTKRVLMMPSSDEAQRHRSDQHRSWLALRAGKLRTPIDKSQAELIARFAPRRLSLTTLLESAASDSSTSGGSSYETAMQGPHQAEDNLWTGGRDVEAQVMLEQMPTLSHGAQRMAENPDEASVHPLGSSVFWRPVSPLGAKPGALDQLTTGYAAIYGAGRKIQP